MPGCATENVNLCAVIERSGSYAEFIDVYVDRGGRRPSESALKYYDIYRLTRNAGLFAAAVDSFNKGNSDKFRLTHLSSLLFTAYIKRLDKRMRDFLGEDTHSTGLKIDAR